ncbi:MAG: RNA methyltransferase [Syntrophales bacterium]|nr:RNA methyltransferase [Syntrophales bacterium]
MDEKKVTHQIAVVLHRPKYAGNVGSTARAMKNMGFTHLIVSEGGPFVPEEMYMMATHFAQDIIEQATFANSLKEALSDFQFIVGTTARTGSQRGPTGALRDVARKIVHLAKENKVALLFGAEDRGLTNEDLRLCHEIVTIPTAGEFKSLNLSHAVMIVCYEVFMASCQPTEGFVPKLATSAEIEGMYANLKEVLTEIGFLNPQNPDYFMYHLRRFFSRTGLLARDVKIIRGICRQISWAIKNKRLQSTD